MQNKDLHRFNIGLNKDDNPADLQPGEYTDALNMRVASSDEQQGIGIMETLQGEVELIIDAILPTYYGGNIGGRFVYEGFESVTIGSQVWAKKNYDRNYYGSRAYGDIEANRGIYGGLYNWDMIHAPGFCPDGWRVPTMADWNVLLNFLGGQGIAGGKMKAPGETFWLLPNTEAIDSDGFTGLGAGKYADFAYQLLKTRTQFWTFDELDPNLLVDIAIITSIGAGFTMTLTGDGFIYIDWGDGVGEIYFLDDVPLVINHSYIAGTRTINIYNGSHIKSIIASDNDITGITISTLCVALKEIDLSINLLTAIFLQTWGFNSLTDYCKIDVSHNLINTISIPSSWNTNLGEINLSYNNILGVNLSDLAAFGIIDISHNNISNLIYPTGTVLWQQFLANDNGLLSFNISGLVATGLERIELQNNNLTSVALPASMPDLSILNLAENNISAITPYATWGTNVAGLRNYDLLNNALATGSVNLFLTTFDAIVGSGEWGLGDRLDLSGTNAAPDGSGMTSYYHLIAQDAIVLINLLTWGTVIDLLDYLWIGEIEDNHLLSATDGRRIQILLRDFATNYIPYASGSLFRLVADSDFILDDEDNLWFNGAGVQEDVTVHDLVDFNYHRTVIRYSNSAPYEISAIGIIKSGLVLTDAQIELLAEAFLLDIFWADTP